MSIMSTVFTGNGNIVVGTETIAPGKEWALEFIRIHLNIAGGANNLTATIDSGVAAVYDTVILTQDMTTLTDLYWSPERPMVLLATDELDFAWTNASARIYGLTVGWTLR